MASARYFRVAIVEVYQKADLVLSELRLYASNAAVDGSATMSSTATPLSGTLANLIDANTSTSCAFASAQVALPGFSIQWDLGGATTVDEIRVTGPAQSTFLHKFTLQSSADAVTWTEVLTTFVPTKWIGSSTAWSLMLADGDPYGACVILAMPMSTTSFRDIKGHVITNSGVTRSATQSKFYGYSGYFNGSSYLSLGTATAVPDWYIGLFDFTISFWVYVTGTGTYAVIGNLLDGNGTGHFWVVLNSTYTGLHTIQFGIQGHTYKFGAATLTTNSWQHVRLSRVGTSFYCFVGGSQLGTTQTIANFTGTLNNDMRIGITSDGVLPLAGYLQDLVIVKGAGESTAGFSLPNAIVTSDYDATPYRTGLKSTARFTGPSVGNVLQSTHLPKTETVFDNANGTGTITGTVKQKALPVDIPLSRKVRLMRERDGKIVRETWSDATTGAYTFTGLDLNQAYTAIAWDHVHTYRAVIADNLTATR